MGRARRRARLSCCPEPRAAIVKPSRIAVSCELNVPVVDDLGFDDLGIDGTQDGLVAAE